MATILAFPTRTLANIAADIIIADQGMRLSERRMAMMRADTDEHYAEGAVQDRLGDRLFNLRAEARALIEARTGLGWDAIKGMGL